eukprot:gnl/TRDRNA2_/TRDRNA2_86757_c1_seq1.p1 gnl/TRDRNA2_/TRDRNA2_86757_c1~~gnl/TRDRNA2_/TRDRNA2_86757_c1_seq1.p1  ORF type:complete len:131 (-),score=7.45 gnl/TRDRNA2_/TRDRNA2_86757_c1_seq1:125-517(-)
MWGYMVEFLDEDKFWRRVLAWAGHGVGAVVLLRELVANVSIVSKECHFVTFVVGCWIGGKMHVWLEPGKAIFQHAVHEDSAEKVTKKLISTKRNGIRWKANMVSVIAIGSLFLVFHGSLVGLYLHRQYLR